MKTAYEVLKESDRISREVIAAKVDGEVIDLSREVEDGADVQPLTFEDAEGKRVFWHTASHVLAAAVKRLYPESKLTIGPSIDNGFYYDIDSDVSFTQETLPLIEREMQRIVKENARMERFVLPRDEAIKLMEEAGEPYKVLLIGRVPEGEDISFYRMGDFVDLCAGPHLFSTGAIKALKLIQCTGAYWEGDSKNKMLQRIYGIAFPKKDELAAYTERMEEAKKRDHRKLGRELDLFDIYEEGPGFPFFLPKGMVLRNILEDFWRAEHRKNHMRRCVDENGRSYSQITTGGKVYRYYDDAPVYPGDVWSDISHLQQKDPERTGYPTQKPLKLLERLLLPVVREGDMVADLCCGSGTAMEAAQSLGCRFVGVDKSPEAILTTASRLECSDLTIDCPCTMDETPLEGEYNGHGGMLLLTGFHAAHPSFPKTEQQLDTLESWSVGKITPEGLQVMQRFRRSRKQPELPWFCVLPEGCGEIAVSTVDAAGRKRVYRWKD